MIIKKHVSPNGKLVVAVCDNNLIGKVFSEGNLQLDLSSIFYDGKESSKEDLIALIPKASSFNFVGNESVNAGKELGLVDNVKVVDKIPFALVAIEKKS